MRTISIKEEGETKTTTITALLIKYNCRKSKSYRNKLRFIEHAEFILCDHCLKIRATQIHHKDRNKRNNAIENLSLLCKACHRKEHHPYTKPFNWNGGASKTHCNNIKTSEVIQNESKIQVQEMWSNQTGINSP